MTPIYGRRLKRFSDLSYLKTHTRKVVQRSHISSFCKALKLASDNFTNNFQRIKQKLIKHNFKIIKIGKNGYC